MRYRFVRAAITISAFLSLLAATAHAAQKPALEVSGWIPYWRVATGTADVLPHLDSLTEINPFGFSVRPDGTLYDALHIREEPWTSFIAAAKAKKVRVIPTVMWSDTNAIHALLSKTSSRIALEDRIANLAKENDFDGIDIDFENKRYEDRDYFSLFLKGLYQRMGKKWVMCSIEARTPVSSRYDGTPPKDAAHYVNDYTAINAYCDRVRLMAYDQGTIDVKLNAVQTGPYIPVSDPRWVEKVVTLAAQTISKKKLVIGIPTYGYEYEVTPLLQGYRYDLQWALNPKYGIDLAKSLGVNLLRNSAGELSFLYTPTSTPEVGRDVPLTNTETLASTSFSSGGVGPALAALSAAPKLNIVWWSDASAIQDKILLAKRLGVRGVAIFKLDGGEDQAMWSLLPMRQ